MLTEALEGSVTRARHSVRVRQNRNRNTALALFLALFCTRDGSRTRTAVRPQDFKSCVSTNSTTRAKVPICIYWRCKSNRFINYSIKKIAPNLGGFFWSERRDSNSRPRPWQGRALPTELLSLIIPLLNYLNEIPQGSFTRGCKNKV